MAIRYEKKSLLNNSKFSQISNEIYNVDIDTAAERVAFIASKHIEKVKGNVDIFSSPGRIEMIGNHTDHNHGEVLAAAVSVDLLAAVTKTNDNIVTINSVGYPIVTVDLNDLKINKTEFGDSSALVRGVAKGFIDRGYKVGGFYATTTSDVFKGAGMSSSAAFELLVSEIFNVYYNGGIVDPITKAIISQFAENVYFGKPSGLMDQSAISFGGISHIDFQDPKNPIAEKVEWPFKDISVAVVNCGGDHANLTPEYAAIRTEMEKVAQIYGVTTLRDVPEQEFYDKLPIVKEKVSGRAILRSIHFFDENKRVRKVYQALKEKNKEDVFGGVNESGRSSYAKLQNCYPEHDHSQTIPLALAIAEKTPGVVASRVHGGGFAGTILVFVETNEMKGFIDIMSKFFGADNIYDLKIRNSGVTKLDF
ncbi:MAG: galactokinase [Clostridiales bacterium]|jgi:galactokinase|nr:galactokinase [Clostridiales bacterium]